MDVEKWGFISKYLKLSNVRDEVYKWVKEAYECGYDEISDGITAMPELNFTKFSLKHPLGVMHDYLYETGHLSRKEADKLFAAGLKDLGHKIRSKTWYLGLRLFGWYYWNKARK
tara:strand:+ start:27452 stop:27793 length:342 start_codon:yes stop_codon:yes gene_type:complete